MTSNGQLPQAPSPGQVEDALVANADIIEHTGTEMVRWFSIARERKREFENARNRALIHYDGPQYLRKAKAELAPPVQTARESWDDAEVAYKAAEEAMWRAKDTQGRLQSQLRWAIINYEGQIRTQQ